MDPSFFYIGSIHIPAYFTMLSIGFLLAIFLAKRWAAQNSLNSGMMIDFGILMVIFGVAGAKILHIFADGHLYDYINVCIDPSKVDWHVDKLDCKALKGSWDTAKELCHPVNKNCLAWLSGAGFAFYGGLVAAGVFSIWYIKKHKWPAGKIMDMGGWSIMLGLAWGRMGCLLAGCCFGSVTHSHQGVSFPSFSPASRQQWLAGDLPSYRLDSLPVFPTQAYESIAALLIAATAYFVVPRYKKFDGQVFIFSMVSYAIARFLLEFIRMDERGGFLSLSTSQLIAIGMIAVCAYFYKILKTRSKKIITS
ncbi:MAG: prolipoprotein diacylglyceryl transferase [Deltaproteobacteria bacterium]|nr:prolipoprotein diacylglyceryl transferase [Deltaproteobacteria bacterium]